jgi:hypothetical protein
MTLNEAQRERLITARDKWRAAEKAYSDEASKYVAAWWMDGPPPTMPEPVTREALEKLKRLRAEADEARTAYYELARFYAVS